MNTLKSTTRNKKRLKESALGYKIEGLELIKEECIDNVTEDVSQ